MKRILLVLGFLALVSAVSVCVVPAVYATNGMNLEGYGPIATGMGGASMAYDNGAAAVMNNPATLGLMPEGDRLDVALGFLGPHIKAEMPGMPDAKSSADAFYMPAFGWVRKSGQFAYGIGMFAQGGMGTEYEATSFMSGFQSMAFGPTTPNQGSANLPVRSEVSMGRLLVPVAYNINQDFIIAGTADFVWASMDLKMVMGGAQMQDMIAAYGGTQKYGSISGSMLTALGGMGLDPDGPINWGYFNFSDKSDFTGKAKATGFAGKIGGIYKVNQKLTVGATYHSKTWLGDLEATGATVQLNVNPDNGVGGSIAAYNPAATQAVTGKIKIKDFQWPQMIGLGIAYQATDNLMIAFDYKWINWADVMKDFKMSFTADNPALGELDATLFQKWKDQNVFMLGAGYKITNEFTMRVGANIANNPIPDTYLNPLFPASIKNHYMIGAGYVFNKASSVDASFTYAPEVKATNGQGVAVAHSQTNAQVMYSYRF
jgi:long-chain fatty acid transport protein